MDKDANQSLKLLNTKPYFTEYCMQITWIIFDLQNDEINGLYEFFVYLSNAIRHREERDNATDRRVLFQSNRWINRWCSDVNGWAVDLRSTPPYGRNCCFDAAKEGLPPETTRGFQVRDIQGSIFLQTNPTRQISNPTDAGDCVTWPNPTIF